MDGPVESKLERAAVEFPAQHLVNTPTIGSGGGGDAQDFASGGHGGRGVEGARARLRTIAAIRSWKARSGELSECCHTTLVVSAGGDGRSKLARGG